MDDEVISMVTFYSFKFPANVHLMIVMQRFSKFNNFGNFSFVGFKIWDSSGRVLSKDESRVILEFSPIKSVPSKRGDSCWSKFWKKDIWSLFGLEWVRSVARVTSRSPLTRRKWPPGSVITCEREKAWLLATDIHSPRLIWWVCEKEGWIVFVNVIGFVRG